MFRPSLIALLVLSASGAGAQISFSSGELFPFTPGQPVVTDVASTGGAVSGADADRIEALVALTGAGRTWDFTGIDFDQASTTTTTLFTDRSGLPGAGEFPGADAILRTQGAGPESYTYGTLSGSAYTVLGAFFEDAATGGRDSLQVFEPDGLLRATFPYTSGTAVSDEARVVIRPDPGFEPAVRQEVRVVGYGTLVLPTGSYPCLMERVTVTTTVSAGGQTSTATATTTSWITRERAVASASAAAGGRPALARYSVPRGGVGTTAEPGAAPLALAVAPNPSHGRATLRLTAAAPVAARVTVWDALGREVARLWDGPVGTGTVALALDTSALAPGVYLARAEADGRALTVRLTVAR